MLRHYAVTRRSLRERVLAYFALGYREYQAGSYALAQKDLARIDKVKSPIEDLAQYYDASAAYKAGHPGLAASILAGFSKRFSDSMKHIVAVELLAWGYLQTGQTEKALHVLQNEPQVQQRPSLALLLARAYVDNGQLKQAAFTYQNIYYAYPATPQAKAAGSALAKLQLQLGVKFPPVSDEIATARVEKLYLTGHYSKALKGYEHLLKKRRNSAWAWRWNLGRAKCMIHLGKANDAIDTLVATVAPTSELDAERLAILVDAYAQTSNDAAIARTINRLATTHFRSHWHAVALLTAANYFMGKGEWDFAPLYYRTLRDVFPKTPQGAEASWRLSWITYLNGKPAKARALLVRYIKDYPDAPQIPAALYFLGRLEENHQPAKARALYELLRRRFRHHYYALEACHRLAVMRREHVRSASTAPGGSGFSVAALAKEIPALDPPRVPPCMLLSTHVRLASFETLKGLHLNHLAVQELRAYLKLHPDSLDFVLELSCFEAEQGRTDIALHMARKIAPDYYSQQFSQFPRQIWDLLYPRHFTRVIRHYAIANHLDPYLVMGLVRQESGFYARATSPADARGLMQILPSTVANSPRYRRIAARRLYGPSYNVRFGCAYLHRLLEHYHGNAAEALAAYNAGPTRVDRWISKRSYRNPQEFVESIPFPGTRIYVKAVLADSYIYRQLLRGRPEFADCSIRSRSARRRSSAQLENPWDRRQPVRSALLRPAQ